MKNKKILFSIITIINFLALINLKADNRIIIYLKNAPQKALTLVEQEAEKEKLIKKINKLNKKAPSRVNNKFLNSELQKLLKPNLEGFIALYSGYMDYSNTDGLISFPLRHTDDKLYVAITPKINLVKIKDQTISHAEYITDQKIKTEIYKFEKKQDNKGNFFWQSTKQTVPNNKRINPLTVVILSKPKNFYVTIGDFLSNDSKQVVLNENIYVLGATDKNAILLNTLDIKKFFDPIELEKRKVGEVEQEMIFNT